MSDFIAPRPMKGTPYSTALFRQVRRTIGKNIHRRRSCRQWPLRKLSRMTGISELLLDHYELGKNQPGLCELLKIACALGVDIIELFKSP